MGNEAYFEAYKADGKALPQHIYSLGKPAITGSDVVREATDITVDATVNMLAQQEVGEIDIEAGLDDLRLRETRDQMRHEGEI